MSANQQPSPARQLVSRSIRMMMLIVFCLVSISIASGTATRHHLNTRSIGFSGGGEHLYALNQPDAALEPTIDHGHPSTNTNNRNQDTNSNSNNNNNNNDPRQQTIIGWLIDRFDGVGSRPGADKQQADDSELAKRLPEDGQPTSTATNSKTNESSSDKLAFTTNEMINNSNSSSVEEGSEAMASDTSNQLINDTATVLELSAFEAAKLGLYRHSALVSVILTIAYSIVFVIGIVGNSLVVAIVCKSPRMRTVTNYFIANLALADILVLLFCLPATLVGNLFIPYVLGQFVCKTVSYLQGVAVSASINTMVTVTLDRFLAICFPMGWHMSRRMARRVIACIWLSSLAIMAPWAVFFTLVPYSLENHTLIQVCAEDWPSEHMGKIYFVCANLILQYLIPAILIIICYLGIWYKIERRDIPGDRPKGLKIELIMQKSKLKVIKMMMVVVMVFLISWLPLYLISARIKLADERSSIEERIVNWLMPLAQWLGASNSCINPILYTFFNRKYKRGFIDLLRYAFCCDRKRRRQLQQQQLQLQLAQQQQHYHHHHNNHNSFSSGHNHNHQQQSGHKPPAANNATTLHHGQPIQMQLQLVGNGLGAGCGAAAGPTTTTTAIMEMSSGHRCETSMSTSAPALDSGGGAGREGPTELGHPNTGRLEAGHGAAVGRPRPQSELATEPTRTTSSGQVAGHILRTNGQFRHQTGGQQPGPSRAGRKQVPGAASAGPDMEAQSSAGATNGSRRPIGIRDDDQKQLTDEPQPGAQPAPANQLMGLVFGAGHTDAERQAPLGSLAGQAHIGSATNLLAGQATVKWSAGAGQRRQSSGGLVSQANSSLATTTTTIEDTPLGAANLAQTSSRASLRQSSSNAATTSNDCDELHEEPEEEPEQQLAGRAHDRRDPRRRRDSYDNVRLLAGQRMSSWRSASGQPLAKSSALEWRRKSSSWTQPAQAEACAAPAELVASDPRSPGPSDRCDRQRSAASGSASGCSASLASSSSSVASHSAPMAANQLHLPLTRARQATAGANMGPSNGLPSVTNKLADPRTSRIASPDASRRNITPEPSEDGANCELLPDSQLLAPMKDPGDRRRKRKKIRRPVATTTTPPSSLGPPSEQQEARLRPRRAHSDRQGGAGEICHVPSDKCDREPQVGVAGNGVGGPDNWQAHNEVGGGHLMDLREKQTATCKPSLAKQSRYVFKLQATSNVGGPGMGNDFANGSIALHKYDSR